jgi:hypothetical protein
MSGINGHPARTNFIHRSPTRLRFAHAFGNTYQEMQAKARGTRLYEQGDAILVWVNQGDLILLEATGAAVDQTADSP